MTAKEFLLQAKRLDDIINSRLRELKYWRDLSYRISSGGFEENRNPNRPTEASFAMCLDKIDEIEREIDERVDALVDLRREIDKTIDAMDDEDERLLLRYRYIEGLTWEDVALALRVSLRTAHRIHGIALKHLIIPD